MFIGSWYMGALSWLNVLNPSLAGLLGAPHVGTLYRDYGI